MAAITSALTRTFAAPRAVARERILAIDALRGVALIAMALRHAASFVGAGLQAETYGGQPVVLESWPHWVSGLFTTPAAPTFWLLSGVSVALLEAGRRKQGASEWSITRFLMIRAGIIALLDFTICDIAWAGKEPYLHMLLSIAISLAILSVARLLPIRVFAVLTLTALLGYQALLPRIASQFSQTQNFWLALLLSYSTQTRPAVEFSILGWFPLMGLGYALGRGISLPILRRPRTWVAVGLGLLGLWLVLRWAGSFGDLTPYTRSQPWYYFLITSKTPPSLTFLLFKLGLSVLVLAAFYAQSDWLERLPVHWLVICGQASLFFFVAHIVVYGVLGRIAKVLNPPMPAVALAYTVWLSGLIVLVPLAGAYRLLRRRHPQSLLRYL